MIAQRIENLRKYLDKNQASVLFSLPNRLYFTGFTSSAGAVIITKNSAYLLVDFRYFEKAKANVNDLDVILCTSLFAQINKLLEGEKIKEIFLETESVSLARYETLKEYLSPIKVSNDDMIERAITNLRSIKSSQEKADIKAAQSITDAAFKYIIERIDVGRTEKEIALELEFFMRKNGADGIAFDTIAISGKNTSLPHGVPTEKKVQKGDLFTMDYGASVNGYCSDMTRTVAVGAINEKQKFVYNTVLEAQKKAFSVIKSGMVCKEVDSVAREFINLSGFEGCFGHGLGHSVGLEIHECPSFNTRDNTILKSGTVITVEPGIYLENEFGVRIEDMVYVTDDGYINLTESSKELIIL